MRRPGGGGVTAHRQARDEAGELLDLITASLTELEHRRCECISLVFSGLGRLRTSSTAAQIELWSGCITANATAFQQISEQRRILSGLRQYVGGIT